ncbi:MAG: polyketide synthase, partial [Deltaproteobacteria bacterium]|nr:polyketide synthase [Deltaproteobacteria bacterium]
MDIAIVGLGCRFPSARDPFQLWQLVHGAGVTFRPVPASRWKHEAFHDTSLRIPDKAYIAKGAYLSDEELKDFGALHFGLAPRRIQVTDPQQRLLIDVVRAALQDAGLEGADSAARGSFPQAKAWDRSRTGVFVGASVSEYKEFVGARLRAMQMFAGQFGRAPEGPGAQELLDQMVRDVVPMRAFSIAGNLLNMIAATVAQQWDLQGPAFSIDSACSSALVAAQQAIVNLRAGKIDVAVAGGVYLNLLPDNLVGFSRIGAISRAGACRPFDAQADGFVMGEGAGALILKRREDAERDGDRIYALVKGAASNNDGKGEGPMTPRPSGQLDALRAAYKDAGFSATTLGYIEAHGTATTVGDVVEVGALRDLLVEQGWSDKLGARTALGSIKANIGHTMSAAGAAGLMKATLALHKRTLPPQPSVSEENPKLALDGPGGTKGPFYLPKSPLAWERPANHPRRAAVSSFGFGGTNAHLVLEEAPEVVRKTMVAVPAQAQRVVGAQSNERPLGLTVPVSTQPMSTQPRAELFLLAGSRAHVAAQAARELLAALPELQQSGATLPSIALTLAGRAHGHARLAVVASTFEQLTQRLTQAIAPLQQKPAPPDA